MPREIIDHLAANRLGARAFEAADQAAFATLSGDGNPMHMDPVAARRTQAGGAVVHGVHGLLWLLEAVAASRPLVGLNAIDARFNHFIPVGVQAERRIVDRGESLVCEVWALDQAATSVKLKWGEGAPGRRLTGVPEMTPLPFGETPDALLFEAMAGREGCAALADDSLAAAMFPALSEALGPAAVAAIAAASGVVGMSCPGLHSMFSQLSLKRIEGPLRSGLRWRTRMTDARARWVVLEIAGSGWEGEIIALARQSPVEPPSMLALSDRVQPGEFATRRALIIGGSRGLGAATAMLIAAGGGHVALTYAHDASEAERIATAIRASRGTDACSARRCDVTDDPAASLRGIGSITHLYYFATPRIARSLPGDYDARALRNFLSVYVDGFADVWETLADQSALSVFYPSTVFLNERPAGMTEYSMAKAAAEQLCADLALRRPDARFMVPRLPRVLTDQTASVPPLPAADAVEIMLPLLRAQAG